MIDEETGIEAIAQQGDVRQKVKCATPANPDGKFCGKPVFNCDAETFSKCFQGRAKGQRWNTFLGTKNDWANGVRAYARQNGNPDFLLKNSQDGTYMFAQKGNGKKK